MQFLTYLLNIFIDEKNVYSNIFNCYDLKYTIQLFLLVSLIFNKHVHNVMFKQRTYGQCFRDKNHICDKLTSKLLFIFPRRQNIRVKCVFITSKRLSIIMNKPK